MTAFNLPDPDDSEVTSDPNSHIVQEDDYNEDFDSDTIETTEGDDPEDESFDDDEFDEDDDFEDDED